KQVHEFAGKPGWRESVAYSPDGRLLASDEQPGAVCVREASTGKLLHRLAAPGVEVGRFAFSPDGRLLAVRHKSRLCLWEAATGRELGPVEGGDGCSRVAFAPDGRLLAGADGSSVRLWDAATRKPVSVTRVLRDTGERELVALAFAPDGRVLALAD